MWEWPQTVHVLKWQQTVHMVVTHSGVATNSTCVLHAVASCALLAQQG